MRSGIGVTWWPTHERAMRHAARVARIGRARVKVERFSVGRGGNRWRVSPTMAPAPAKTGEPCS